jgi:hypothetical protein
MARDIEEFLRRAAERRKQAQQGGSSKPQRPPARRQPPKQPPPRLTITEDDVIKPRNKPLPSSQRPSIGKESVSAHVNRYLDVSDIVQHVDQLGDVIENADERMEAHLDEVFDHDVGKLSSKKQDSVTDKRPKSRTEENDVAKGILKMLQSPKTVRQAIMVAEVLKRPNFDDEE